MMKKVFLALLCLGSYVVSAQKVSITGEVFDEFLEPFPGATVKASSGEVANSDYDGKFTLKDVSLPVTLTISALNHKTEKFEVIRVNQRVNIILKEADVLLSEVLITGYTKQKKERLTSAASTVEPEGIKGMPRSTLQESLQGKVSGVQVVSNTGQPGETPTIRIRGVGSFQKSAPLYILDGLQVGGSTIASVNPSDVVNISVLKDAAATSIYGVRGANGVIVITTSSGETGKTKINYSTQAGVVNPTVAGNFKPLSTPELQELLVEGAINGGYAQNKKQALAYVVNNAKFNPDVNTSWYDEIIRTGSYMQHNLSLSGGSEATQFYLSGGYFQQEGVVKASDYNRLNTRLRLKHNLNKRINFNANLAYSKETSNVRPSGGSRENPIWAVYRIRPDQSVYNEDGTYNLGFNKENNPVALAEAEKRINIRHRILGGISGEYNFFEGFKFKGLFSTNTAFLDNYMKLPSSFSDSAADKGIGSQDMDIFFNYTARGMFNYEKRLNDDNKLNLFAGYEITKSKVKRTALEVHNILDNFTDLNNGVLPVKASTGVSKNGVNSLFFNGEYAYKNKYLFSASVRRDGSSRFAEANRFGNFWSVGFGWDVTKEDFMQNQKTFNQLKIRGSYGVNGSDNIGGNGFISRFATNDYNNEQGFYFQQIGNKNLKWEENIPLDLGVDFALLKSRITGSFDWYQRKTKDLLRYLPIPRTNGVLSLPVNIGEMQNTGIELELISRNIVASSSGFDWTTNFNFSKNTNKVTKVGEDNEPIIKGEKIIKIGEDVNTFFLPLYAGVDPATGKALWYKNGDKSDVTNNYNDAKPAIVNNASPDFYGSIRNEFVYKGFSLDFQFYTAWGGAIYDEWGRFTNSDGSRATSNTGNVSRGTYNRRWQKPGDITDVPAYVFNNSTSGSSNQRSSRFIYDGSYIRLRELGLAYAFTEANLQRLPFSKVKFYVKGTNLWTYVHDERLERDPEAGLSGVLSQRIPVSKTVFIGLDVSF